MSFEPVQTPKRTPFIVPPTERAGEMTPIPELLKKGSEAKNGAIVAVSNAAQQPTVAVGPDVPLFASAPSGSVFTEIKNEGFFGGILPFQKGFQEGFGLNQGGKIDNTILFKYLFPPTTINKSEITNPTSTLPFSIMYQPASVYPNVILNQNGQENKYKAKKAFLYKVLHKITNVTVDNDEKPISGIVGELVIKIEDNNNGRSHYLCAILKSSGSNNINEIDKMIALKNAGNSNDTADSCTASGLKSSVISIDMKLGQSIPQQNWVIYYTESKNNANVFVLTNPIMVNNATADAIKGNDTSPAYPSTTSDFDVNANDWIQINNIGIIGEDEIYIDCQPTGVSDEEIQMRNIPLANEENKGELSELQATQTFANFMTFTMILVISYFVIPVFYKFLIIDTLNLVGDNNNKMETYFQIFLSSVLIILLIGVICFQVNDPMFKIYGTSIFIFALFFSIIIFQNTMINKDFTKTGSATIDPDIKTFTKLEWAKPRSILELLSRCFFGVFTKSGSPLGLFDPGDIRGTQLGMLVMFMLLFGLLRAFYGHKYTDAYLTLSSVGLFLFLGIYTLWERRSDSPKPS